VGLPGSGGSSVRAPARIGVGQPPDEEPLAPVEHLLDFEPMEHAFGLKPHTVFTSLAGRPGGSHPLAAPVESKSGCTGPGLPAPQGLAGLADYIL